MLTFPLVSLAKMPTLSLGYTAVCLFLLLLMLSMAGERSGKKRVMGEQEARESWKEEKKN